MDPVSLGILLASFGGVVGIGAIGNKLSPEEVLQKFEKMTPEEKVAAVKGAYAAEEKAREELKKQTEKINNCDTEIANAKSKASVNQANFISMKNKNEVLQRQVKMLINSKGKDQINFLDDELLLRVYLLYLVQQSGQPSLQGFIQTVLNKAEPTTPVGGLIIERKENGCPIKIKVRERDGSIKEVSEQKNPLWIVKKSATAGDAILTLLSIPEKEGETILKFELNEKGHLYLSYGNSETPLVVIAMNVSMNNICPGEVVPSGISGDIVIPPTVTFRPGPITPSPVATTKVELIPLEPLPAETGATGTAAPTGPAPAPTVTPSPGPTGPAPPTIGSTAITVGSSCAGPTGAAPAPAPAPTGPVIGSTQITIGDPCPAPAPIVTPAPTPVPTPGPTGPAPAPAPPGGLTLRTVTPTGPTGPAPVSAAGTGLPIISGPTGPVEVGLTPSSSGDSIISTTSSQGSDQTGEPTIPSPPQPLQGPAPTIIDKQPQQEAEEVSDRIKETNAKLKYFMSRKININKFLDLPGPLDAESILQYYDTLKLIMGDKEIENSKVDSYCKRTLENIKEVFTIPEDASEEEKKVVNERIKLYGKWQNTGFGKNSDSLLLYGLANGSGVGYDSFMQRIANKQSFNRVSCSDLFGESTTPAELQAAEAELMSQEPVSTEDVTVELDELNTIGDLREFLGLGTNATTDDVVAKFEQMRTMATLSDEQIETLRKIRDSNIMEPENRQQLENYLSQTGPVDRQQELSNFMNTLNQLKQRHGIKPYPPELAPEPAPAPAPTVVTSAPAPEPLLETVPPPVEEQVALTDEQEDLISKVANQGILNVPKPLATRRKTLRAPLRVAAPPQVPPSRKVTPRQTEVLQLPSEGEQQGFQFTNPISKEQQDLLLARELPGATSTTATTALPEPVAPPPAPVPLPTPAQLGTVRNVVEQRGLEQYYKPGSRGARMQKAKERTASQGTPFKGGSRKKTLRARRENTQNERRTRRSQNRPNRTHKNSRRRS